MCYSRAGKSAKHEARSHRDVSDVTEQSAENAFLGTVSKTMGTEAWHVHVFIENQRVRFKMDTGADVTVIPDTCVPRKKTPLQKSAKGLFGPGQNSLQVLGKSSSKMECKGAVNSQDVYVVKNLQEPLLGRPTIEVLQELTTFITPFGRFCFKQLPFGISSGPEVFHRIMLQLLSNIPGVICDIDDIQISGCTQQEHDQRQKEVLQRLEGAGVTLNDKCAFSQKKSIKFLGHFLTNEGVQMGPSKVEAIHKLLRPPQCARIAPYSGNAELCPEICS